MKQLFMLLMTLVLVAACSPTTSSTDSPSTTAPNNAPTSTVDTEPIPTREGGDAQITGDPGSGFGFDLSVDGDGFVAVASGDNVALEFDGEGFFACENSNTYAIRPSTGALPLLTIIVPADITVGTYTIGDRNIMASVVTADNAVYAGIINGILVLDAVATESGQRVTGNFDVDVSNGSNTINARGEFDFMTTSDTVFCR
ncbi:MAG: hypothetical protein Q9P44_06865 [Anaerolineae bacterium]|nr:hypothetical protein [Anaerolineae bacterium]